MKRFSIVCLLYSVAAVIGAAHAQTLTTSPATPSAAPSAGSQPATPPPSAGGFSIEADLFAYQSLQSDSEAIACDVAGYFAATPTDIGLPSKVPIVSPAKVCAGPPAAWVHGVVLVSSTGSTLANYQTWRTTMLVMKQLLLQSRKIAPGRAVPPSLVGAGQVLTLVQGVLGLFASNQSASGIAGTISDQALMNDVSRQLRNLGVNVLMPDTYTSYSFGGINPTASPFVAFLSKLMNEHTRLQIVMQQNLVIVNAAQKLQADLSAKAADVAKLSGASNSDKPAISADMASLDAEITKLNQQLRNGNVDVGLAVRTVAQAQSLLSAIEAFVTSLTGGGVAFTAQSTAATPSPSPSPTTPPATGTPPASPTTAAPQQTATVATPAAATGGTPPPIVAVLAADGLARAIGVAVADAANPEDSTLEPEPADSWRLLWLKTLESGGSLITTSNIFGSKVHFSGGAIATYDLFDFTGKLSCSGVAFAYGGYVKAKDFPAKYSNNIIDPTKQSMFHRGGCSH
jgi:hypothetical protein